MPAARRMVRHVSCIRAQRRSRDSAAIPRPARGLSGATAPARRNAGGSGRRVNPNSRKLEDNGRAARSATSPQPINSTLNLAMTFEITIKPSDHRFECEADETILAGALRAGLLLPY